MHLGDRKVAEYEPKAVAVVATQLPQHPLGDAAEGTLQVRVLHERHGRISRTAKVLLRGDWDGNIGHRLDVDGHSREQDRFGQVHDSGA
jgi:hypothetical protein